jgi:hypothetical protein
MLVDPDECAVDEDIFEIGIVAEGFENMLPNTLLGPAPETRIYGEPLAEGFRQIAPWRTCARDQRAASIKSRLSRPRQPRSPALPDSFGAICTHWASLNINRIKAGLHFEALNQSSTDLGILFVNRP